MIRLVGRMKDVIKSGGYSVYVRELEEAIVAHPQSPVLPPSVCPTRRKARSPSPQSNFTRAPPPLKSICSTGAARNSPPYKAPRRIWILEPGGLPHNHTGKLLRRVLQRTLSRRNEVALRSGSELPFIDADILSDRSVAKESKDLHFNTPTQAPPRVPRVSILRIWDFTTLIRNWNPPTC